MTTIAPRIKKILAIVEEIKAAIEEKGVTVPASAVFGDIPNLIRQIVTAGECNALIINYIAAAQYTVNVPYILDALGSAATSISSHTEYIVGE